MGLKILIADDDTNICDLLKLYLENEGYEIVTANDGIKALSAFKIYEPDLVLHYSRDEDGEEFNSEDMVEMYDGIYVKTFVIFFGELIRYYITEEHDNSIEVKESNRLTCNNIPGDNDHSRYNLINEMIISDTLSDETTLKSNIDEYKRLDAATKQLFKLI